MSRRIYPLNLLCIFYSVNLKFSEIVSVIHPEKLNVYDRFSEEMKSNLNKKEYDKVGNFGCNCNH